MWSEEYSTPEEDTNSSYVLARCQEVATNTVTALLFASTAKHRWNGKQNNLLFLLLLCKYIHQGLSPISIRYTVCWQWPGFYLLLSDTMVDHIPPEMPSVLAHLWLPSSRHQHGLSAGEIATEVNFQSLIFQHLRFKVFTVYVAPSLVPRLSPNAYCKRQKAGQGLETRLCSSWHEGDHNIVKHCNKLWMLNVQVSKFVNHHYHDPQVLWQKSVHKYWQLSQNHNAQKHQKSVTQHDYIASSQNLIGGSVSETKFVSWTWGFLYFSYIAHRSVCF